MVTFKKPQNKSNIDLLQIAHDIPIQQPATSKLNTVEQALIAFFRNVWEHQCEGKKFPISTLCTWIITFSIRIGLAEPCYAVFRDVRSLGRAIKDDVYILGLKIAGSRNNRFLYVILPATVTESFKTEVMSIEEARQLIQFQLNLSGDKVSIEILNKKADQVLDLKQA